MSHVLWLIPLFPLAACVVIAALGSRWLQQKSHWPCLIGLGLAFFYSLVLLFEGHGTEVSAVGWDWITVGGVEVELLLQADSLTRALVCTVLLVSFLVALYSAGYMHGDPGYVRYFAEISLFVFAMTMLLLSGDFLLLYVFWEGVGLCSYLLIGYWFDRPSAAAAAKKAFLVNRIGDFGFLLGILLIWKTFGSLRYSDVFDNPTGVASESTLTLIALLLMLGAVGKSAQFPLHVWLPDAMEGPSPVSALIHAATMVTAGVYMIARCMPLFAAAPGALLVVAAIGGFTALLAAWMALGQYDLKRVLAYSTISQLGYMFLGLGAAAGSSSLATLAAVAAIFHLITHAFFKALLFLAAGSVMHAMGDVIDMREFSGLRRLLPQTNRLFLCGALALAGFIPFAGFWSKDEIFVAVMTATGEHYGVFFSVLYLMALLTAFMTAMYTFRAYFLTFFGPKRTPEAAGDDVHESPRIMLWPMIVLAVFSVAIGLVLGPTHWLMDYLVGEMPAGGSWNWAAAALSTLAAGGGIGVAWLWFGQGEPAGRTARIWRAIAGRSWKTPIAIEGTYQWFVVGPLSVIAVVCRYVDDYFVDGIVDLIGRSAAWVGELFRPVQNGVVQFYALAMLLGIAVLALAMTCRLVL